MEREETEAMVMGVEEACVAMASLRERFLARRLLLIELVGHALDECDCYEGLARGDDAARSLRKVGCLERVQEIAVELKARAPKLSQTLPAGAFDGGECW